MSDSVRGTGHLSGTGPVYDVSKQASAPAQPARAPKGEPASLQPTETFKSTVTGAHAVFLGGLTFPDRRSDAETMRVGMSEAAGAMLGLGDRAIGDFAKRTGLSRERCHEIAFGIKPATDGELTRLQPEIRHTLRQIGSAADPSAAAAAHSDRLIGGPKP